jgi:hypothetical protein
MIDHLKRPVDAADARATRALATGLAGNALIFGINCG